MAEVELRGDLVAAQRRAARESAPWTAGDGTCGRSQHAGCSIRYSGRCRDAGGRPGAITTAQLSPGQTRRMPGVSTKRLPVRYARPDTDARPLPGRGAEGAAAGERWRSRARRTPVAQPCAYPPKNRFLSRAVRRPVAAWVGLDTSSPDVTMGQLVSFLTAHGKRVAPTPACRQPAWSTSAPVAQPSHPGSSHVRCTT